MHFGSDQWSTHATYDGYTTTVQPPSGGSDGINPTVTVVDAFGRTVSVQDGSATNPVRYSYNRRGDLKTITDPHNDVTINTYYDLAGVVKQTVSPDAGTTDFEYDLAGNVTRTGHAGRVLNNAYDADERLRSVTSGAAYGTTPNSFLLRSWTYGDSTAPVNQRGQLTSQSSYTPNSAGSPFEYRQDLFYDARARLTAKTWTIPSEQPTGISGTYTESTGYDGADHPTSITYPGVTAVPQMAANETVTTAYDYLGHPNSLTSSVGATYIESSKYNVSDDRIQSRVYGPSGSTTTPHYTRGYAYDTTDKSRLLDIATFGNVSGASGTYLQYDEFAYDNAGDVTSLTDYLNPNNPTRECYSYDGVRRLTHAYNTTGACGAARAWSGGNGVAYDQTYDYGNSQQGNNQLAALQTLSDNLAGAAYTYTYPSTTTNQPHAAGSVTTGSGTTQNGSGWKYNPATGELAEYDSIANGAAAVGATFDWDMFGQLADIRGPAGPIYNSNIYDPSGKRLIHKLGNKTTLYLDGMEVSVDTGAGTTSLTRYYAIGGVQVAERTGDSGGANTPYWTMQDRAASAQLLINALASLPNPVSRLRYTPFGVRQDSTSTPTSRGFLNKTADTEVGLDQLGARYYSPIAAMFISPDPLAGASGPQSLNPYGYANNNPVNTSDPSGLVTCADESDCHAEGSTRAVKTTPNNEEAVTQYKVAQQKAHEATLRWGAAALHDCKTAGCQGAGPLNAAYMARMDYVRMVYQYERQFGLNIQLDAIDAAQYRSFWYAKSSGRAFSDFGTQLALVPAFGPIEGAGAEAAEEAATSAAASRGGIGPVLLGQAGEAAVRGSYDIGPKATRIIDGRTRIFDGLNDVAVSEVKNVQKQGFTQQLKDSLAYAQANGLRFDLYVHADTVLTGPLSDQVLAGRINLEIIP